jgi:probable F420-dependent oxidoreductase
MAPKPFRFGIHAFQIVSRQEWRSKAIKAEELGYSTLLLADHLWTFPPIAGMVAAAEATTTLRIGTNVLGNDYRHPALVAGEAAAVDLLSEGRLEFGIGSGYHPVDYQKMGIPLDPPGVRVGRLEEAVQVIKGLWSDEPYTFAGKYYSINDLGSQPKPVQKPHPPIMIGGGGKRVMSLAAREADIVGLNFRATTIGGIDIASLSQEGTTEKIKWIREAAGARFDDLELAMWVPFAAITTDREAAAERLAEMFRRAGVPDMRAEHVLASPHSFIGSVDQIVAEVQERREQYGISYYIFRDQPETLAPVVARLRGT